MAEKKVDPKDCDHSGVKADGVEHTCGKCGMSLTRLPKEDKSWPPKGIETK